MSQLKDKFIHLRVNGKTHAEFTEACKPKSVTEVLRDFTENFIKSKVADDQLSSF